MGWVVWFVETLLCACAGYTVAAAAFPDRSSAHRAAASLLVSFALIITAIQLCGVIGHLDAVGLGISGALVFATTLALGVRAAGRVGLGAAWRTDLRAPVRLVRDIWTDRDAGLLVGVPGAVALGIACVMVWYFKTWVWDASWYHQPITSYAIQNHSLAWVPSHNLWVTGYPRNASLIAVWNCVFPRDNRLDDSSQIPFALFAAFTIAAWARRVGASRPLAMGLGLAWIALPPMFLQVHSNQADVVTGALLTSTAYHLGAPLHRSERWFALLALGMYVGTKFTGAFHAVLIAPWVLARVGSELRVARGRRIRTLLDALASVVPAVVVGAHKYVQNAMHTGNPFYPFRTVVPVVHHVFAGPKVLADLGECCRSAPGTSPWFFGSPGDFMAMLASWMNTTPTYAPDVRGGGFGNLFLWMLVPATIAVGVDVVRARRWRVALPIVLLFALAVVVPGAWWPRYIMGAAAASLVALAYVVATIPNWWVRTGVVVLASVLAGKGFEAAYPGLVVYPRNLRVAMHSTPARRAELQTDLYMWTTEQGALKEHDLRAGDGVAYDEGTLFLSEFFCRDYRTRVMFLSTNVSGAEYAARLRREHVRWASVRIDSPAERVLREGGATMLFDVPVTTPAARMYRVPAAMSP